MLSGAGSGRASGGGGDADRERGEESLGGSEAEGGESYGGVWSGLGWAVLTGLRGSCSCGVCAVRHCCARRLLQRAGWGYREPGVCESVGAWRVVQEAEDDRRACGQFE